MWEIWATNSCGDTTILEDNLNATDEAVPFSDYLTLIYQHMPHNDIFTKIWSKGNSYSTATHRCTGENVFERRRQNCPKNFDSWNYAHDSVDD